LKRLPTGTDIKFSSPDQANEIQAFLRLNLQALAAGIGVPKFLLSGDLTGANYSSLRAGLLPFRQRCEQIQYHVLVPQFLDPVWMRVQGYAALGTGEGSLDGLDRVEWIMPRQLQVDPQKDTEALVAQIDNRLTSRRRAVAELGWDIDALDEEIAADQAREEKLGISKPAPAATANQKKEQSGDGQSGPQE
jgi:capsid protein